MDEDKFVKLSLKTEEARGRWILTVRMLRENIKNPHVHSFTMREIQNRKASGIHRSKAPKIIMEEKRDDAKKHLEELERKLRRLKNLLKAKYTKKRTIFTRIVRESKRKTDVKRKEVEEKNEKKIKNLKKKQLTNTSRLRKDELPDEIKEYSDLNIYNTCKEDPSD